MLAFSNSKTSLDAPRFFSTFASPPSILDCSSNSIPFAISLKGLAKRCHASLSGSEFLCSGSGGESTTKYTPSDLSLVVGTSTTASYAPGRFILKDALNIPFRPGMGSKDVVGG